MKFAPMAIPAMALLQQHDVRRDILIEPVARRRAAIEAWGHSELGAQSGRKNQPACYYLFVTNVAIYFILLCVHVSCHMINVLPSVLDTVGSVTGRAFSL